MLTTPNIKPLVTLCICNRTSNVHPSTCNFEFRRSIQPIIVGKRIPARVNNRLHVTRREEPNSRVHTVRRRRTAVGVLRVALPDLQVVTRLLGIGGRAKGKRVRRVGALRQWRIADLGLGVDLRHAVGGAVAVGDVEAVRGDDAEAGAACVEVADAPGGGLGLTGDGGR